MNIKNISFIISGLAIVALLIGFILGKIDLEAFSLAAGAVGSIMFGLYQKFEKDEIESILKNELIDTEIALNNSNREYEKLKGELSRLVSRIYILQNERDNAEAKLIEKNNKLKPSNTINSTDILLDTKDETPKVIKRKPKKTNNKLNTK